MGKALTKARGHQLMGRWVSFLLMGSIGTSLVRWHSTGAEGTSSLQPDA